MDIFIFLFIGKQNTEQKTVIETILLIFFSFNSLLVELCGRIPFNERSYCSLEQYKRIDYFDLFIFEIPLHSSLFHLQI